MTRRAALAVWMPFASAILCAVVIACPTSTVAHEPPPRLDGSASGHWSLQPLREPAWPELPFRFLSLGWERTRIDRFVAAKMAVRDTQPAPPAERTTLFRRAALDLTGLPPSPTDVAEFEKDESPDAYERHVDRWLASPRFGERMAQAWLDVVRYAETEGFEYDNHRPGAWRYRDWVIDRLNADEPFDAFARDQLAGDELSPPTHESLVAAGFHRLGPVRRNAGNTDVAFSRNEVLTEMTDAVGLAFLGLTVGCARCHDHKFDPISQVDYYRLQAYLGATDEHDMALASPEAEANWKAETKRIKDAMQAVREAMQKAEGQERDRLVARLKSLENELPKSLETVSSVRNDREKQAAVFVLKRGQTDAPGDKVGARPLSALVDESLDELPADVSSPKMRLADWIVSVENPLTRRVLANRIWQTHFGTGIVATPNDFGVNGAAPTNEALLDELASQVLRDEWRLKPLHRRIVTSAVYRQRSSLAADDTRRRLDPENVTWNRFPRRRLDAEQLRDVLLAVGGTLDLQMHGSSVIPPVDEDLVSLLYKPSQWEVSPNKSDHHRRSVYLIAKRNLRLPFLATFDQPDLAISCGRRESSTHAPQSLELLNGELANACAESLAERLQREAGGSVEGQTELAFRLLSGRSPTADERTLCESFLRERSPREFVIALFQLHAFLYVE